MVLLRKKSNALFNYNCNKCSAQYKGTSHVMKSMIKQDGFRALYRGLSAPTLGFGLTFAISFRFESDLAKFPLTVFN